MITTRTAAALLLAATLALSACGDDDENATATSANNAAASAYAAPDVTENPTDLTKQPMSGKGSGDVTKLEFKDLVVGKGKVAKLSDTVTVHYVGTLFSDGTVFDSSWDGDPAQFSLSGVVPGFAQGIAGMKIGGRRQIVIPSELAYGASGRPPVIPPNAALVFIVDLKSIP